jgi:hypothetical protein
VTSEERIRDVLERAADLPGLRPAPVDQLVAVGRRLRRRRRIMAAASTAIAVAAAATAPVLLTGGHVARGPGHAAPASAAVPFAATLAGLRAGHWSQLPDSPLGRPATGCAQDGWTGHALVVMVYGCQSQARFSAATYVPGRGWRLLPSLPASPGSEVQLALIAGDQLIVVATQTGQGAEAPDMVWDYSQATGRWSMSRVVLAGLLSATTHVLGVAELAGRLVLAWAPYAGRLQAVSYDISSRTWRPLNVPVPAVRQVTGLNMVAAGARLIILESWSDAKYVGQPGGRAGVEVRALSPAGTWQAVSGWPQDLVNFSVGPLFGDQLLVRALSLNSVGFPVGPVYLATWPGLRLRAVPAAGGLMEPTIWTGAAVLATSTAGSHLADDPTVLGPIEALAPGDGRWHQLPAGPVEQMALPVGPVPVWTGTQLLVTDGLRLWSFGS